MKIVNILNNEVIEFPVHTYTQFPPFLNFLPLEYPIISSS